MSPRHRTLAVAATLVAVAVSACANSPKVETSQPFNPGDGALGSKGDVRVLNAIIVAPAVPGGPAVLSMRMVNQGQRAEQLLRVTVGGATTAFTGTATLPASGVLTVGGPDATTQIVTTGDGAPRAGASGTISFLFRRAGTLDVQTTVVAPDGYYAGFTAAPESTTAPLPTPEPTATATGAASPTEGPTPTETESPSPSRVQETGGGTETVTPSPSS